MDSGGTQPPRKKSRFFANGESKVGPIPGRCPSDEATVEPEGSETPRQNGDTSQSMLDNTNDDGAGGGIADSTISEEAGIMVQDRASINSDIHMTAEHDTRTSRTSSNKRHGIYGAQNLGLPPFAFTSLSTGHGDSSLLPGGLASHHYPPTLAQNSPQPLLTGSNTILGHTIDQHHPGLPIQGGPTSSLPPGLPSNLNFDPYAALQTANVLHQHAQRSGSSGERCLQLSNTTAEPTQLPPGATRVGDSQDVLLQQRGGSGHGRSSAQHSGPLAPDTGSTQGHQSLPSGMNLGLNLLGGSSQPIHLIKPPSRELTGGIDVDRDANGVLLPLRQRRGGMPGPANSIDDNRHKIMLHKTPPNFYTSPQRIQKTIAMSSSTLKRKFSDPNSAPPAYIYVHTNDPNFNVFTNGILMYPELCLALATHLPLRDLVSLYSISKDFHTIMDSRFTTVCLMQALKKAPQSAQAFRFRSYAEYCRKDPAARLPHPDPAKAAKGIPRLIPSFRWVAFVMHRQKVIHELMTVFAERGCPLPARCSIALIRLWMLFDVPDNARRIAMIHNHRLFTELDLYFLTCFFIKLDMVANDPVAPRQRNGLRKLLLSQQGGPELILKVLKREMWQKQSDVILAWVRTTMNLDRLTGDELDELNVTTILGIPRREVGRGKYEYWGLKGLHDENGLRRRYLLRPDQLVLREAIRRGLRFEPHYQRCLLYGYIRPDTLESYEPRKYGRRIADWDDGEYNVLENLGGFRALAVEDGGDPLLDLGDTSRGSRYTVVKETVSEQERGMRAQQAMLLEDLYRISEEEQLAENAGE